MEIETENKSLLFDARQRRVKLICDCLDIAMISIKNNEFDKSLDDIDDAFCVSNHLIKNKKVKFNNKEIPYEDAYYKLRESLSKLANDNPDEWSGKTKDTAEAQQIKYILRKMYSYIMFYLEDAGFFGTSTDDEGL